MSWREDIERWSATGTLVAYIDDLARAVVDQEDEFATAQSHLTHALDDAATQRARADAAEAECARLTACLKRGNAAMEQMERELYLRIVDIERERDAMEEQRDTARSAHDGLVAAVRAEREAAAHFEEADNAFCRAIEEAVREKDPRVPPAVRKRLDDAREKHGEALRHLDALIAAAPAPTTVPAAEDAWQGSDDPQAATAEIDRRRAALDAALGRCV